jgi:ABC-type glycerol-3-phosphate transport system permease component
LSALPLREQVGVSRWRRRATRLGIYLGLAVITVVMLYPFWSMGIASFRSLTQFQLGHGFSLASWRELFRTLPVGRELANSALITLSAIGLILLVSTTCATASRPWSSS